MWLFKKNKKLKEAFRVFFNAKKEAAVEFLKSPLNIFVSESFFLYNLLKLQVILLLLQYFKLTYRITYFVRYV